MRDETAQTRTDDTVSKTAARRQFLHIVVGSIALGTAGCSSSSSESSSSKTAKNQVSYQDQPQNGNQCSGCQYFVASGDGSGAGKCQKVTGRIANDGWCSLYTSQ
jgi:anaerobic selenocysteine-containing dehydrogenase